MSIIKTTARKDVCWRLRFTTLIQNFLSTLLKRCWSSFVSFYARHFSLSLLPEWDLHPAHIGIVNRIPWSCWIQHYNLKSSLSVSLRKPMSSGWSSPEETSKNFFCGFVHEGRHTHLHGKIVNASQRSWESETRVQHKEKEKELAGHSLSLWDEEFRTERPITREASLWTDRDSPGERHIRLSINSLVRPHAICFYS